MSRARADNCCDTAGTAYPSRLAAAVKVPSCAIAISGRTVPHGDESAAWMQIDGGCVEPRIWTSLMCPFNEEACSGDAKLGGVGLTPGQAVSWILPRPQAPPGRVECAVEEEGLDPHMVVKPLQVAQVRRRRRDMHV